MADDDSRTARQKALAEKKRRLEEIKARRQNRPSATTAASASPAAAATASGGNHNLDDYIDSLLKTSTPGLSGVNAAADTVVEESTDASEVVASSNISEERENDNQQHGGDNDASNTAATMVPPPQQQQQQPKVETFEIATQCEEDDFPPPSLVDDEGVEEEKEDTSNDHDETNDGDLNNVVNSNSITTMEQTMAQLSLEEKQNLLTSPPFNHFLSTASKRVERLLGASDEGLMYGLFKEKGSWGNTDFSMDYAAQDSKEADDDNLEDEEEQQQAFQSGGFFTAKATYACPKWTNGRNVTDIEWCPSHKEWVLASYNNVVQHHPSSSAATAGGAVATRNLSPNEQFSSAFTTHSSSSIPNEGIIAIYNLTMPERPEHIFCSGCPIVHSQFHPVEHPKLILGGGTSGQVLVWDARVGRYPVQRSSIGSGGHDVELVGMKVLGGGSGGNEGGSGIAAAGGGSLSTCKLVTASSDGKVNYWSVSNLRDPVETVKVDANLSCLDVLQYGSSEGVVCGDERGGMHAIFASSGRDGSGGGGGGGASSKRVVRTIHPGGVFGNKNLDDATSLEGDDEALDSGHYGMVTAVAARPAIVNNANTRSSMKETTTPSSSGMSKGFLRGAGGLLVTTGVDWSTKLWAPGYTDAPLMSFLSNSYDYMSDVQWSPVHPSVFATASSNGTVNIWNLAASLDQPISGTEGISIDEFSGADSATASSSSRQGLNRLKWSADGRRMAVASGDKMHVLGVGEDVWKTKGDEEGKVMNNLLSRGLIQE
ncbi:cytoplasmic dynein intermediate chain-like protein [Skeletonema marinoi]|uniref:Cytoplasmic dynein intermediate chain-like protein n=2 Tax=Skeletonema marinoi TaxID=267567 RepID=A0AAD9DFA5_9STRA|nr:cytoplasmic dynein intermediate chain-like protein [Skeletonema marinoi]